MTTLSASPYELRRATGVLILTKPLGEGVVLEMQRAPDLAGAPNLALAEMLPPVPVTQPYVVDPLPDDGAVWWYRQRGAGDGYTASPWTEWVRAVAQQVPTPAEVEALARERLYTGLNADGRVQSGVEPSADINGVLAQLLSSAAGTAWLETFEQLPATWNRRRGTGTLEIVSGTGVTGGTVLRATGDAWLAFPANIPYDPSKLYRLRARVRNVTAPGSGVQRVTVGVEGVAANGVTLVNESGANATNGQHYACVLNDTPTPLGTWVTYTGWFKGSGTPVSGAAPDPRTPKLLHPNVRYFRPLFVINDNLGAASTGVAEIDYLALDVFDEDAAQRLYAALDAAGNLTLTGLSGEALQQLLSTADQLAPNGNFEQGAAYWHGNTGSSPALDTTEKFGGAQSLRLPYFSGSNNDWYSSTDGSAAFKTWNGAKDVRVRVSPGDVLRIRGACRVSHAGCGTVQGIRTFNLAGAHLNWITTHAWSGNTSWQEKESWYVVPEGVYYVTPWFRADSNASPTGKNAWFDELRWDKIDKRAFQALRADGALEEGVTQYDGARGKLLARGLLTGTGKNGDIVTFSVPFQRAPLLILTNEGGITDEPRAKWGPKGDGTETGGRRAGDPTEWELSATEVALSSFKISARLAQRGSTTPAAVDFPVGNAVFSAGATIIANAFTGTMPGQGNAYQVHFRLTSDLQASPGFTVQRTYVVTVDVDLPGTGSWSERAAQSYVHGTDDGPLDTMTWADEAILFTLAGLTTASKVRLRLKSITTQGRAASGSAVELHGHNPTNDGAGKRGVTYTISTGDQFATMTPNATGREIRWVALEI